MAEPHLEELATWVRQLAEALAQQGYPVGQLLTQAGISDRALQGKDARIPFMKNAAFFEFAAEATENSNLGLEFAQSRDTRDAGLLRSAIESSTKQQKDKPSGQRQFAV